MVEWVISSRVVCHGLVEGNQANKREERTLLELSNFIVIMFFTPILPMSYQMSD